MPTVPPSLQGWVTLCLNGWLHPAPNSWCGLEYGGPAKAGALTASAEAATWLLGNQPEPHKHKQRTGPSLEEMRREAAHGEPASMSHGHDSDGGRTVYDREQELLLQMQHQMRQQRHQQEQQQEPGQQQQEPGQQQQQQSMRMPSTSAMQAAVGAR